jgi:hypothetical protein
LNLGFSVFAKAETGEREQQKNKIKFFHRLVIERFFRKFIAIAVGRTLNDPSHLTVQFLCGGGRDVFVSDTFTGNFFLFIVFIKDLWEIEKNDKISNFTMLLIDQV